MQSAAIVRVFTARSSCALARNRSIALTLAFLLLVAHLQRLRAEDHVDYRYGYYKENDGRMEINTHGVLFDATLKEGLLAVNGELVYDAVSGATPIGIAPPYKLIFDNTFGLITGNTNDTSVPVTRIKDDVRQAGSISLPLTLGVHTLTPQFAYSEENDYKSTGAALNYALLLNDKNTTLTCGWAHTWDRVKDVRVGGVYKDKSGDDFLIGINQLLGPKSVLSVNLTYGQAYGMLDDPYRAIGSLDPILIYGGPQDIPASFEQRPQFREKIIGRVSLTQFITPANASVEAAYRFYHDNYDINAHTVDLAWYQKIGKHVILSPNLRYSYQSAASFYTEMLTSFAAAPRFYSSDYRLSEMQTLAVGLNLTVKATEWLSVDLNYKYYTLRGLDGVTSQTAYPSANIAAVGFRINF